MKNKLLFSFLSLFLLVAAVWFFSFYILSREQSINDLKSKLDTYTALVEHQHQLKLKFLLEESNDLKFHSDGKSTLLNTHDSIHNEVMEGFTMLQTEASEYGIKPKVDSLLVLLEQEESTFDALVLLLRQRGFKDFGLSGKMRKSIHELESNSIFISLPDILMLRRHEKDFLLRNDSTYVTALNLLCEKLKKRIGIFPDANQDKLLLEDYQQQFNAMVTAISSIGEFGRFGLKESLSINMQDVSHQLALLVHFTHQKQESIILDFKALFTWSAIFIFIAGIGLSYYFASARSKGLVQLAAAVKEVDIANFHSHLRVDLSKDSVELSELQDAFNQLLAKAREQFTTIINERRLLEDRNIELEKLNHELDSFVYSVSHDLRAPLTSLLGLINLTRLEPEMARIMEYNDLKEGAVMKLEAFIQDVLNISRNARQAVQIEPIAFKPLIDDIWENQRFSHEASSIFTQFEVNQASSFCSDSQRLKIVLNNLMANAIRYSDQTKANRTLNVQVTVNQTTAIIEVSDNGIGISAKHLPHIFEMFYRATDKSNGSGLGLYIAAEAVHKMKGKLEVESKQNVGTLFRVSLPNLA